MALSFDSSWMWYPSFQEDREDTSGSIVGFRRSFFLENWTRHPVSIHITADTRYKLYVNGHEVAYGPVKGDTSLWFYDEVDIGPYLKQGDNRILVRVLRLFYGTTYAPSFARSAFGGLRIKVPEDYSPLKSQLESSTEWETAIDEATKLRVDEPEDAFLHIYEHVTSRGNTALTWIPTVLLYYKDSTGNAPPWNLSSRRIPEFEMKSTGFAAIHNIKSSLPDHAWKHHLIDCTVPKVDSGLVLPAGTTHRIDLEMTNHTTAFLSFHFQRPTQSGSILRVKYSECYEDQPEDAPWIRRKGGRCDYRKELYGPSDIYEFEGHQPDHSKNWLDDDESPYEVYSPFHWRTFRFVQLEIEVGSSDLVFHRIDMKTVHYPLHVEADFHVAQSGSESAFWQRMWDTSVRTLRNCMHDCYEDCPFYEQLQYAMDTRSSALFTYLLSRDDRLARQAIVQIHNSFQAQKGLTASRAPSHRQQFIPSFSLFWACTVCDHFEFFADGDFVRTFMPVIDAILAYFDRTVNTDGLVTSKTEVGIWNYVDWTTQWKPHGIPPGAKRVGISTFTNQLYAYTLQKVAKLATALGRPSLAVEYGQRSSSIVAAVLDHCYDGSFFTDTLATESSSVDRSQHCQVWAVLSGIFTGDIARDLLHRSLTSARAGNIVQESTSMSFYTFRALSLAGGSLYDEWFNELWGPWRAQLELNLTTWIEDGVSQRSDCHAWGSVAIYELLVEVLGIRPVEPGFTAIELRPRTTLFSQVNARVPLSRGKEGSNQGKNLRVYWEPLASNQVQVSIKLEGGDSIKVYVPDLDRTLVLDGKEQESRFVIDSGKDIS
ncbi:glycoside hydrolase family 78 protein [Aaosphaeria arxii CBS 175.79]|uniref:Glycoside hydrolase family 78 protein n=1 Tax=Aaosphaeria arxii CBS 175.79 TaxID=1450172 RepID=A0A6A5XMY3_9PLEO|nr:glycoside hydrolase family 78 protein [Aaosphaeria arxii CBS 175.79]KAF2014276.1 glycoside hydrolase family 78 protein [Aaosphaeria arxii CBS 175.79]